MAQHFNDRYESDDGLGDIDNVSSASSSNFSSESNEFVGKGYRAFVNESDGHGSSEEANAGDDR